MGKLDGEKDNEWGEGNKAKETRRVEAPQMSDEKTSAEQNVNVKKNIRYVGDVLNEKESFIVIYLETNNFASYTYTSYLFLLERIQTLLNYIPISSQPFPGSVCTRIILSRSILFKSSSSNSSTPCNSRASSSVVSSEARTYRSPKNEASVSRSC